MPRASSLATLPAAVIRNPLLTMLVLFVAGGALGACSALGIGQRAALTYQTATVERGNLEIVIAASGPITSAASLPLNFSSSGRLVEMNVKEGDRVKAGQVLARIESADLEAQVAQAESDLKVAQADQETVLQGPTDEDVEVAEAQLAAANSNLVSAEESLAATRASAEASVAAALGDVESREVDLAAAERELSSAGSTAATAVRSQVGALGNARVA